MSTQISHWRRVGEIWVFGEYQGMLAGYYGKKTRILANLRMSLKLFCNLHKHLKKADRKRLTANLKQIAGAQNFRWRKQVCGNSNYYYIDLIAIDSQIKGSGAFRRLITPILQRAKRENMPVLLDTHNKDNVPIYKHFGFELVQEHRAKSGASISQYSMMKRP